MTLFGWSLHRPEVDEHCHMQLILPVARRQLFCCLGHASGRFLSTPLVPFFAAGTVAYRTHRFWPPVSGRFLSTSPRPTDSVYYACVPINSHEPSVPAFALSSYSSCTCGNGSTYRHLAGEQLLLMPAGYARSFDTFLTLLNCSPESLSQRNWHPVGGRFLSTPPMLSFAGYWTNAVRRRALTSHGHVSDDVIAVVVEWFCTGCTIEGSIGAYFPRDWPLASSRGKCLQESAEAHEVVPHASPFVCVPALLISPAIETECLVPLHRPIRPSFCTDGGQSSGDLNRDRGWSLWFEDQFEVFGRSLVLLYLLSSIKAFWFAVPLARGDRPSNSVIRDGRSLVKGAPMMLFFSLAFTFAGASPHQAAITGGSQGHAIGGVDGRYDAADGRFAHDNYDHDGGLRASLSTARACRGSVPFLILEFQRQDVWVDVHYVGTPTRSWLRCRADDLQSADGRPRQLVLVEPQPALGAVVFVAVPPGPTEFSRVPVCVHVLRSSFRAICHLLRCCCLFSRC